LETALLQSGADIHEIKLKILTARMDLATAYSTVAELYMTDLRYVSLPLSLSLSPSFNL